LIHKATADILNLNAPRKFNLNASFEGISLDRITNRPHLKGKINLNVNAFVHLPVSLSNAKGPSAISAEISANINSSKVLGVTITGGKFVSNWDGQKLGINKLDLLTEAGRLNLSGVLIPGKRASQIRFNMDVPRLENAVSLVNRLARFKIEQLSENQHLSGRLEISGELNGWWDQPAISAKVIGNKLKYDRFSAGKFQLDGKWQGDVKNFRASALGEIKNIITDKARLSELKFTMNASPDKILAQVSAANEKGVSLKLAGEMFHWNRADKLITINTLKLKNGTAGQAGRTFKTIVNSKPIHIKFSKGALDIASFELVSDRTTFSLTGQIFSEGKLKTDISINRLDLKQISWLWKDEGAITGILSANTNISGSLTRPIVQTRLKIQNGSSYNFPFTPKPVIDPKKRFFLLILFNSSNQL